MGFVFGIFLGMMGDMQPLQMVNGREVPQAPLREQVCVSCPSDKIIDKSRSHGNLEVSAPTLHLHTYIVP